jgi:hypothetical protein
VIKRKKLFVVLGMHRSGTSLITKLLECFGICLGEKLIPAADDNQKGFFEDYEIVNLNEKILEHLKNDHLDIEVLHESDLLKIPVSFRDEAVSIINNRLEKYDLYGLKDPRICKLLPFWNEVFKALDIEVNYIISIRNPKSVVDSLVYRNKISREKGYWSWITHTINAISCSHANPRILIDYDSVISSPKKQIHRIASVFNLKIENESVEIFTKDFIDSKLRHSKYTINNIQADRSANNVIPSLYSQLLDVSSDKVSLQELKTSTSYLKLNNILKDSKSLIDLCQQHEVRIRDLYYHISSQNQKLFELGTAVQERDERLYQASDTISERDKWLLDAKQAIEERDEQLIQAAHEIEQVISQNSQLRELTTEQDAQIGELNESIAAKDRVISEKDLAIGVLGVTVANRDGQIIGLHGQLTAREEAVAAKDRVISEKDREIGVQKESVANREGIIRELQSQMTEKEAVVTEMNNRIMDLENQLLEKKEAFAGLSSVFNTLRESLSLKVQQIEGLQGDVAEKNDAIDLRDHDLHHLRGYLDLIKSSWSWRLTAPLRTIEEKANFVFQTLKRYRLAAWIIWTHRKTGIFDPEWYLLRYPDVRKSGMNAFWHFVMYGVYEGRSPHGLFTEDNYKLLNPDISGGGAMHYITNGWREGRNIQVLFDKDFYLKKNKDVKKSGVDPVIHYLKYGSEEGRRPHPYVNQEFYINSYKDIKECGIEPISHYLHWGWKEGRRIMPLFDTAFYLNHNHDIRDCGMEPFSHYILAGGVEGRNPNPIFNAQKAWERVPKMQETAQNPLFYYLDGKWDEDPSPEQTLFLAMVENEI